MIAAFQLAAALLLSAPQAAAPPPSRAELVKRLDCTPFEWVAIGGRERGAIRVPVEIGGETLPFQLDTGADISIVYGREGATLAAKAGGMDMNPMYFVGRNQAGRTGGTLALDALVGRVAVIDYPGQQFCLMTPAEFPYAIYARTTWADATLRHGKLFVPVTIGEQEETEFFFDTGASLFPLSVDLDRWQTLTGLDSAAEAGVVVEGQAFGRPVRLAGAPMRQPVSIAGASVPAPMVFFREDRPAFMAEMPMPAEGLIGNAAVWDHVVVLYLGARPQFGIVR